MSTERAAIEPGPAVARPAHVPGHRYRQPRRHRPGQLAGRRGPRDDRRPWAHPSGDRCRRAAARPAAALSGQGATRAVDLLLRGVQPSRHLGLQARADQAARPADARRRQADHLPGQVGQPDQEPLDSSAPAARSGKYISDLLPHLAELADEMCFIHSMTSKTNTHGPGENLMSTGFMVDGYPEHRLVGQLCPGQREREPAGVRGDPRSARRAASRPQQLVERLPAGRVSGHGIQRRPADRQPGHAVDLGIYRRSLDARLSEAAQRPTPGPRPGRQPVGRAHRQLRAGGEAAAQRAGGQRPVARNGRHARGLRHRPREHDQGRLRPQLPPGPAAARARACGSSSSSTGPTRWARASATGTATRRSRRSTTSTGPSSTSPPRPCLKDLKARGMLDDTLVVWTTEFGRMPTFQRAPAAATTTPRALPSGWPARA